MGRGGSKAPIIKELERAKALFALGKTYHAISIELNRDPKTIKKWLTSSPEVVEEIKELKKEIACLYDDLAQRILQSITDETIKEAKLRDRVISAGVCTDKSKMLEAEKGDKLPVAIQINIGDYEARRPEQHPLAIEHKTIEENNDV